MSAILTLLRLLIAAIIAGALGFTVTQFCILWAHVDPIGARMYGVIVFAAVGLAFIAATGLQARKWH